jgi:hypothetical protein
MKQARASKVRFGYEQKGNKKRIVMFNFHECAFREKRREEKKRRKMDENVKIIERKRKMIRRPFCFCNSTNIIEMNMRKISR